MTTEFVQSRRNPPVLIPLSNPETLPHSVLLDRLTLIERLIASRRSLDKIEQEEKDRLCAIIAGTHNPRARHQAQLNTEMLA